MKKYSEQLENQDSGEDNYVIKTPSDFQPDNDGLGQVVYKCMKANSKSIAQYIDDTGEKQTYQDLLSRSIRTALHLRDRNITKNDIITLCSPNHKDAAVPFLAGLFLTIPVASLDTTLSLIEMKYLLNTLKPRIIFASPESLEVLNKSLAELGLNTEIVVYGKSQEFLEFFKFLEPHKDESTFTPVKVTSLDDAAVIYFSSGSTGLPKGIVISHYSLSFSTYNLVKTGNVGKVALCYSTFYWISSSLTLISTTMIGGARVICSKFEPRKIWEIIETYKVTYAFISPIMLAAILKIPKPAHKNCSSFRRCIISGGKTHNSDLLKLRELLPQAAVFEAYGFTELANWATAFNPDDERERALMETKPTTVGMLMPGMMCKIVNPDTEKLCGPNEPGELTFKCRGIMKGYYNKDSSACFDKDGWLLSGDIGYYDEDGCFFIVDRIKELIKYRSNHISPILLEQVLLQHPAVDQAAVIGVPHPEDMDHPLAFIVPDKTYKQPLDLEEIQRFVDARVSDVMRLRGGIKMLEKMPMTPSGKLKKRQLKEMVIKGEI